MRTYGRVYDPLTGAPSWVEVQSTDGFDDMIWLTTLIQALKLNLGESPFFADYGIPSHQSVMQQIHPDYYVAYTQRKFAGRFASLIVAKVADPEPTYRINVVTHQGVHLNASVPVPG